MNRSDKTYWRGSYCIIVDQDFAYNIYMRINGGDLILKHSGTAESNKDALYLALKWIDTGK